MNDELSFLPYGRQSIDEDDIAAVVDVLRGDWLTQGPTIDKFEEDLATAVGARFAVSFSNGTAALHGACLALGLGPGDEVITTPLTFSASANCARYVGAKPVLVDVEPQYGTLCPDKLVAAINSRTRAIIPVHYAGLPAEMDRLHEIASARGIPIIEDAAHALGARIPGGRVGDGRYSAMTMFSFHPVKHITTGEGGAITTNDEKLYDALKLFRSHGITRNPNRLSRESPGPWYQEQVLLGYNYRLTDIQAALGRSQLRKLDGFVARRREIAARYDKLFAGLSGIRPLGIRAGYEHAYHLYVVLIDFPSFQRDRAKVMTVLRDKRIGTQVHYVPLHHHPDFAYLGHAVGDFVEAEKIYASALSLPMYPAMTNDDVDRVVSTLREVLGA
jgi:UDP-4-amino-4,6-dideoxy-N-acetyl-beta-L-altrosamine transaminase